MDLDPAIDDLDAVATLAAVEGERLVDHRGTTVLPSGICDLLLAA